MEKLLLKHIVGYFPYGLKVQYFGITNSKELSDYDKKYKKDNPDDIFKEGIYLPPDSIEGLKIGFLRRVEFWKKHNSYFIGNKTFGLQTHYNTDRFKPILRPLSDLTKEIEVNGEKFVPIKKYTLDIQEELCACLRDDTYYELLPYFVIQKLYEWHFDIHGLIEKELAIDINTLDNGIQ